MSIISKIICQLCLGLSLISMCELEAKWSWVNGLSTTNTDVVNDMDAFGNATAIWTEMYSSNNRIFSSNLFKIENEFDYWPGPETIYSAQGRTFFNLNIAVDSSWNTIAVWEEFDGSTYKVSASTRPFKGRWSTPIDLSTATPKESLPKVAISPNGQGVVVWVFEGTVQAATYQFDGTWSSPTNVSLIGNASGATVSIDDAGNALAVWSKNGNIKFSKLAPGGNWTKPANIAAANSNPQLSMNASGFAVVAWKDGTALKASTLQSGQNWSMPALIKDFPHINDFTIAADTQGNVLAIWQQQDEQDGAFPIYGPNYLMASTLSSGKWSDAVKIAEDISGVYNANAGFDEHGNALVVYNSYSEVLAVTLPYQKEWTLPTQLDKGLYGLNTRPKVSVDSTGYAVITWSNEYGAIKGIRWVPKQ